jgi:hypothetical protein
VRFDFLEKFAFGRNTFFKRCLKIWLGGGRIISAGNSCNRAKDDRLIDNYKRMYIIQDEFSRDLLSRLL